MFTPGFAIIFLATILRPYLLATCVASRLGFSNILSADSLVSFYYSAQWGNEWRSVLGQKLKEISGLFSSYINRCKLMAEA